MLSIQNENLTLAASRAHQVEQLLTAGRAARYDLLRANVARSNIEPLVIQAQNDREIAELDLKRLLNVPVGQAISLTTSIDATGLRMMLASLDDSTALPDRASLRSAELQLAARRQAIAVARADLLPTATVSFTTGYQAFPPLGFGHATVSERRLVHRPRNDRQPQLPVVRRSSRQVQHRARPRAGASRRDSAPGLA
jgi:outer membrane protein TolC